MVDAYTDIARRMLGNGLQCAMFTRQDTGVWSDMVGVFWAAGLHVASAWHIATETAGPLKQGGHVQGTVILALKKRHKGEKSGYRQLILPEVRAEARRQIETMMHLNDDAKHRHGSPIFNDSGLQMAGYAAALKVLTAYTRIGGENVDEFALRPRRKAETTLVEEIVGQASEVASNLLTPECLTLDTWSRLYGVERFALRMLGMESKGASKLDNYQNFAKAFRVEDYARLMGSVKPNAARLKRVVEFESRDFFEHSEFGKTKLGRLVLAMRQLLGGRKGSPQLRRNTGGPLAQHEDGVLAPRFMRSCAGRLKVGASQGRKEGGGRRNDPARPCVSRARQILPAQTLPSLAPPHTFIASPEPRVAGLSFGCCVVVAQAACGGFPKNCSPLFLRANNVFSSFAQGMPARRPKTDASAPVKDLLSFFRVFRLS